MSNYQIKVKSPPYVILSSEDNKCVVRIVKEVSNSDVSICNILSGGVT